MFVLKRKYSCTQSPARFQHDQFENVQTPIKGSGFWLATRVYVVANVRKKKSLEYEAKQAIFALNYKERSTKMAQYFTFLITDFGGEEVLLPV